MINKLCFFSFPSKEEERRKWVNAVKRKNWKPSKTSRICSAHFREEDINRTLRYVMLKEGAVPTVFAASQESQVKDRRPLKRKIQLEVQSTIHVRNVSKLSSVGCCHNNLLTFMFYYLIANITNALRGNAVLLWCSDSSFIFSCCAAYN